MAPRPPSPSPPPNSNKAYITQISDQVHQVSSATISVDWPNKPSSPGGYLEALPEFDTPVLI